MQTLLAIADKSEQISKVVGTIIRECSKQVLGLKTKPKKRDEAFQLLDEDVINEEEEFDQTHTILENLDKSRVQNYIG